MTRRVGDVDPSSLAEVLSNANIRRGNARSLRSFVVQIYNNIGKSDSTLTLIIDRMDKALKAKLSERPRGSANQPTQLEQQRYDELFKILETDARWQRAYCIRLSFNLRAPLGRIMQARWTQIKNDLWYPYQPSDRRTWNRFCEGIRDDTAALLCRVKELPANELSGSDYWFPTVTRSGIAHIRSIGPVWRDAVERLGVGEISFRDCRAGYKLFKGQSWIEEVF